MRILVFGATGGVGRHFVQQALTRGHQLVVCVSDPVKFTSTLPSNQQQQQQDSSATATASQLVHYSHNISIIQGDFAKPATLDNPALYHNVDAAVSFMGLPGNIETTFLSDGMNTLVRKLHENNVQYFTCITSAGCDEDDPQFGYFVKWVVFAYMLNNVHAELRRVEQAIINCSNTFAHSLQYTIVRPPQLNDNAPTGKYRISMPYLPQDGSQITRGDLALATLDLLEQKLHGKKVITVAN